MRVVGNTRGCEFPCAQSIVQGGPCATLGIGMTPSGYSVPGQAELTSSKQLEDLFIDSASHSTGKARLEPSFCLAEPGSLFIQKLRCPVYSVFLWNLGYRL